MSAESCGSRPGPVGFLQVPRPREPGPGWGGGGLCVGAGADGRSFGERGPGIPGKASLRWGATLAGSAQAPGSSLWPNAPRNAVASRPRVRPGRVSVSGPSPTLPSRRSLCEPGPSGAPHGLRPPSRCCLRPGQRLCSTETVLPPALRCVRPSRPEGAARPPGRSLELGVGRSGHSLLQ